MRLWLMECFCGSAGQATFEDVTEAIGMDAISTTVAAGCAGELVAAQVRPAFICCVHRRLASTLALIPMATYRLGAHQ